MPPVDPSSSGSSRLFPLLPRKTSSTSSTSSPFFRREEGKGRATETSADNHLREEPRPGPGGCDRARLGRRSRRKGKTWERELAALLRPLFGEHVKRGFQSRCGRDGCDVEGTPFWLEAKHGKLVNVRAALRQALEATDGRPAVVVAKDDRSAPLVVMRLEDWLGLVEGRRGGLAPAPVDAGPVARSPRGEPAV
jgi:hypothetical protein